MPGPARDETPRVFAGVDIGGTTTQVVLCGEDLAVLGRTEVPTPAAQGGEAMLRAVLDAVAALRARVPSRLLAVGVGAAGVVDARAGRVLVASDSFSGWAGTEVTATLGSALDVPAFLDNDVNAFLYGEVARGAVAGERNALGMTLGTGVGGALWMNGSLVDGPHGAAGEIGHIPGFGDILCTCGGRGHLETLASGRSIAARYRERTGRQVTATEVAAAATEDDPDARAVFDVAGWAIARAILITAGVVDITTVVIGGGVSRAWELLEPPILRALGDEPPVSGQAILLARTRLGSDAVAIGAAARARTEVTAATCA
ncbi:ROK family protein [Streptacidiphilus fuscans]|uniref:ROK family protein n=1 Tax=Streptacidiphilus fuscans TaxID=2789292 RepID=A0A931B7U0_9ACTN|nr:ROK family protein [Streptacidiphilus fuscans]MBF9072704.1 ROK family protein [Streptacidiphilus fuscans]